jgi:hypothetical protein
LSNAGSCGGESEQSAIYVSPAEKFAVGYKGYNYCYFGGDSGIAAIKKAGVSIAAMVAEGAAEALVGAACLGTAGLGCAVGVALLPGVYFMTGAAESWFYTKIDKEYYWPSNPDIESKSKPKK